MMGGGEASVFEILPAFRIISAGELVSSQVTLETLSPLLRARQLTDAIRSKKVTSAFEEFPGGAKRSAF
jgi:hypothetical protein